MTSVGVSAPGTESLPAALVAAITSGCRLGLTTNSAPALMVSSASAAVVTVPDPRRSFDPYSSFSALRMPQASGHVIVTSTTVTPPAIMASTTACACLGFFARRTGIRPTRSMICAVVSDIFFSFCSSINLGAPASAAFAPNLGLPRNSCRSAFHRALHVGHGRHACIARCGHGQRTVRHPALHCPLHCLAGEESINQARGETIPPTDAIENVNVALRYVRDVVLVERD